MILRIAGKIEGRLSVLHKCDNRKCFNPDHLFLGDHVDNAKDMVAKGRQRIVVPEIHWTKKHPELVRRGNDHHLSKSTDCMPRGENHKNSKVTDEIVRLIRADGGTYEAIGKKYGISASTVYSIIKRQTWQHVY